MVRTFRVAILASGKDAPIEITGVENYIVADESHLIKRATELVIEGVKRHGIEIKDLEFDVLSFPSGRWLDQNQDLLRLPEEDSLIIMVSKEVKKEFGDDPNFYISLTILDLKLREEEKEKLIINLAKSLEQLISIIRRMEDDEIDMLNRIITFQPNFMGIGVNLMELFRFLKRKVRFKK